MDLKRRHRHPRESGDLLTIPLNPNKAPFLTSLQRTEVPAFAGMTVTSAGFVYVRVCFDNIRNRVDSLGAWFQIGYAAFMREMSDEQLMQRYAKGDASAFDQLYARHRGPLYRYFNRQVNDAATSNDLYQGAWEKIIRSRDRYRPSVPFTAWMYRLAHNHLVDHFRRMRPAGSVETDTLPDEHPGPVQDVIDGEQDERLRAGIIALPLEQRNTLLLKLETGLKIEEIASVTGVSMETVKSRLRYAVDKLKRSLVE